VTLFSQLILYENNSVANQAKSISPPIDTIPKNYLLIKLKYWDRTKNQQKLVG
jgi:hypothetical protein